MKWEKMMPINKEYSLLPDYCVGNTIEPKKVSEHKNSIDTFYIRLQNPNFNNWVIAIDDIQCKDDPVNEGKVRMSFEYLIASVPQTVTDAEIETHSKNLEPFLSEVMNDILITALNELKKAEQK